MPAGFGYGAVGGTLRRLLGRGAGGLEKAGGAAFKWGMGGGWARSSVGTFADASARGLGAGLSRMSRMSNVGLGATMGAIGGATYGAFSDNTSMLGGAMMGAGLGAGGVGAARLGRTGVRSYRAGMGMLGQSRGQALGFALKNMGKQSSRFIGNTSRRAVNGFRGLQGGVFPSITLNSL